MGLVVSLCQILQSTQNKEVSNIFGEILFDIFEGVFISFTMSGMFQNDDLPSTDYSWSNENSM